jgi:hypothetical protein
MMAELDAQHRIDLASRDGRQRPGRTADRVRVEPADERPVPDVDVLCASSARILHEPAWQLAEITGLRLRRLRCEGEA